MCVSDTTSWKEKCNHLVLTDRFWISYKLCGKRSWCHYRQINENISSISFTFWISSQAQDILLCCVNHASGFCNLDALTSVLRVHAGQPNNIPESPCLGLLPPSSLSPQTPPKCTFQVQTNKARAHTQAHPLLHFHTPGHCSPALITSGPGTRQQSHAPESVEIIIFPKPAYLVSPILSHRNSSKSSCPSTPYSLPPDLPWSLLQVTSMASSSSCSWELWVMIYIFNGDCLLMCWLYYT